MVTPETAASENLKYRKQQVQRFRDEIDSHLKRGWRSVMSWNGLLHDSEIEQVIEEYRAAGWHVRLDTSGIVEELEFSETPFPERKNLVKSLWQSIMATFGGA